MKRVAALWLPDWSIDRILRAEPKLAPPPDRRAVSPDLSGLIAAAREEQVLQCDAPKNSGWRPGARWARSDTSEPRGQTRRDVEMQIAALPHHQRPPMRMLGRSSEAADHPFRAMPPDPPLRSSRAQSRDGEVAQSVSTSSRNDEACPERPACRPADGLDTNGVMPMREMARRSEAAEHPFRRVGVPSVRYPGEGPRPDKHQRRGSNDPHSAPPGVATFFDTGRTMAGLVGQVCREDRVMPLAPAAAGVALVTAHKIGSRVEVAAASPAAKALGIVPGMAMTQVRASVPDIVVRDADPEGDAADLHALAVLIARRWTPLVAKSDTDALFLDLTGVAHLHGGERAMALRLLRLLARFGFAARIGIADSAGAAWALARFVADPLALCPAGAQAQALAPLPALGLRLPEPTLALFQRLGIETIGDVAALPRAPFARRFGAEAARRLDQALGHASEPLDPVIPPETIHVVQRFAEPIGSAEAIAHWLARLVPQLTEALAQAGQGARALLFVADRIDGQPQPIRIGFARPNRDPAHILRLIVRRIEEVEPGFGIDALHLHVRRAEPLEAQPFDQTLEDAAPDLGSLVDLLANRDVPTWREMPIESDVPERSVGRRAPLDAPKSERRVLKRDDVAQLDRRATEHPWQSRWPRPARVLRRPERLDHVIAELPDQPPKRFTWRGKRHVVVRADGPERITGEWWKSAAERDAVRDYFLVEDDAGQRFWLFRRGDGERDVTGDLSWYLHGRFA